MGGPLRWILICQVISSAGAFFVDSDRPIIFQDAEESFGYQVVQMGNRLIVSAPLHQEQENKTGQLYQCDPKTALCDPMATPESADDINMSFGLSLTVQENDLLACGPTLQKTCGRNIFVKGRCYLMRSNEPAKPIPQPRPECTVRELDIVFLVDCSGSIKTRDLNSMVEFVRKVIESSTDKDTHFALVLFSESTAVHFDFNRYSQTEDRTELTRNVRRHGSGTYTSSAILNVMQELFVQKRGARDNAEKVLIVITDGKSISDPTPFPQSIQEANKRGVRRFVIGVGSAFSDPRAYEELVTIASPKPDDHILRVGDFSLLLDFQRTLQDKIFAIEGTQSVADSSFQLEMSQEGFSAILTQDGPILGAVGAYDWSGGIFMYVEGQQESSTWINATRDRTDMRDSYMGYAVQRVQWDTLAIGAPRHQHLGSVFIYKKNLRTSEWSQVASFTADKIGSYFGSVMSFVRVNSTQALLVVGAPTYYSAEAPGGQVYLCPVTEVSKSLYSRRTTVKMECPEALQGDPRQPLGHFGSSISILPDLTGDGLPDLAVGAPCEDNYQGAVYIFPGQDESFRTSYVQRVSGQQVSRGIRYFGRSLSGNQDMTGDNLQDLAVGGEGRVLILRSRPVLGVFVHMAFNPSEIPLSFYECSKTRNVDSAIELTVCFFSNKKKLEVTVEDFGQVTYSLLLDPGRVNARALFTNGDQALKGTLRLTEGEVCVEHSIKLPECVDDSLPALRASIDFFLVGTPVLSEDSSTSDVAEVSFQKNCGGDGVCRDKLSVNISFTGVTQLVVGSSPDVNVTLSVMNEGDESYNAHVLIPFPSGLSYRLVTLVKSNKKVTISCQTLKGQRVLKCGVNERLLRPHTKAVFMVTFHVSPTAPLGNSLTMTANITSDNRQSLTDRKTSSSQLSVRYAVFITVTSLEESTKNQNFSSSDSTIQHIYRVNNQGQRPLPLTLIIRVPVKMGETSIWKKRNITSSMPDVSTCVEVGETPGAKNYQEILRGTPTLDCSVGWCVRVECEIPDLEVGGSVDFTGSVTTDWITQTGQQKISLQSSAEVTYDSQKYAHLEESDRFLRARAETKLEILVKYNYLPIIIGSSAGGLVLLALITAALYKLGFFKRQYKELLEDPAGAEAALGETAELSS